MNCGFANEDSANFCLICGNQLASSVKSFYDQDSDYYSEPRTIYDNDNGNNPYDDEFIENIGGSQSTVEDDSYYMGGVDEPSQYNIPRSIDDNSRVDEEKDVSNDAEDHVKDEVTMADYIVNEYKYRKLHEKEVARGQQEENESYRTYDTQKSETSNNNTGNTTTGYSNPEYNNSEYNNENTYNNTYPGVNSGKSKFLTFLCSFFFIGGGYIYLGEYMSFILFFAIAVLFTGISGGVLSIIVWLYCLYDCMLKVDLYNNGEDTSDLFYGIKNLISNF
ncbi:hypothetical protein NL43_07215 [Methanosphaera sp. WGK6]|nr:hypothetical protein NL43_07215 [Methanosphaera sp. WGK6]